MSNWVLGFNQHDIPVLVGAGLLKPFVRPPAVRSISPPWISEWFNLSLEEPVRNGESVRSNEPKLTEEPRPATKPAHPERTKAE